MNDEEAGRIIGTTLGWEDHGILTAWIAVEGEGWGQSFGGYALDGKPEARKAGSHRTPSEECGRWVAGILRALEVDRWEGLMGQIVRVRRSGGRIAAIGHAYKNRWFDPETGGPNA